MTFEIVLLLLLLAATLAAFVFELAAPEVIALSLLSALLLTGLVTVEEAVAGLSNKAVVAIGCLFVLSHALVKTGFLELAAERLSQAVGPRRWLGVAILLAVASVLSGLLNNTALVAIFIPLTVDLCRRFEIAPSRVLLPLSYAGIFGGTLTLVGTSTNLLVGSMAEREDGLTLGMFEFTPMGLVFLAVGLAYVLLAGPRLLPDRGRPDSLTRKFEMASFLTELRVLPTSKMVGKTVTAIDLNRRHDVTLLAVERDGERIIEHLREVVLSPGDLLVVRGSVEKLLRVRADLGVALLTDIKLDDSEVAGEDQVLVEALVPPNSPLIGDTLAGTDFRRRYGAFVLAIRRLADTLHDRLAHTPLRFSDTLLMVTSRERLEELRRHEELVVTSELEVRLQRHRFWWLVMALLPAIMILAAVGAMEIAAGALVACVALLVSGAIAPREAYRSVDWSVIFFIAAFVPLGDALFRTGAADYLAQGLLAPARWFPPEWVPWVAVSLVYLGTSLLTSVISNNATAIVLTPVVLGMAHELGAAPRPFVFALCFAASASFMTPTGYQTNMMVYGPGGYRFLDFLRFGAPLNLLFWILGSLLIPRFWPLA